MSVLIKGIEMKAKFKVIDSSTGKKVKLESGQMITMNGDGSFFVVKNMGDYYQYVYPLHEIVPKFEIVWRTTE